MLKHFRLFDTVLVWILSIPFILFHSLATFAKVDKLFGLSLVCLQIIILHKNNDFFSINACN